MADFDQDFMARLVATLQQEWLGKRDETCDVIKVAELVAAFDSADYYQQNMNRADPVADKYALLEQAVRGRMVDGVVLEFGVATGNTLNHLARLMPEVKAYGFDWFKGLPEQWRPGYGVSAFIHEMPQVEANVELVHGLFEDTLPGFVAAHPGPVSLLHVDCDLYSSTRTIFAALGHAIVPGTMIVFDEYFNYPGWRQHEYRAFKEFVAASGRRYEYLGLVPHDQQVSVRITG